MPIPITEAVDEKPRSPADQGRRRSRRLPRYLLSSACSPARTSASPSCCSSSVGAPLVSRGSPFAKLVQGAVFGIALTLVVFAGAELFTGNDHDDAAGLVRGARSRDRGDRRAGRLAGRQLRRLDRVRGAVHAGVLDRRPARSADLRRVDGAGQGRGAPARSCSGGPCSATRSCASACGWRPAPKSDAREARRALVGAARVHRLGLRALDRQHDDVLPRRASRARRLGAMLVRNLAWTIPGNIVGGGDRGWARLRVARRPQGPGRAGGRDAGGGRRPRLTRTRSAGDVLADLEGAGVAAAADGPDPRHRAGRACCAAGRPPPRRRARRTRARRAPAFGTTVGARRTRTDSRRASPRVSSTSVPSGRRAPGPASAPRPHRGAAPRPAPRGSRRGRAPSTRAGPAPARRRG